MSQVGSWFAALVVVAFAAGCSGGGDSKTSQSAPTGYTLAGTARAAAATLVDGDTADPAATPAVQNDTSGAPQVLPGAVTVGGWASKATDVQDWYQVNLTAGQVITLAIADWASPGTTPDLDLYLTADGINPDAMSATAAAVETLTVPTSGQYYVLVEAWAGSSNYTLTIGQAAAGAVAGGVQPDALDLGDGLDPSDEFVPGEVIVTFREGLAGAASVKGLSIDAQAARVGMEARAGAPGQELLLGLGEGARRAQAFATLGIPDADPDPVAAALADPSQQEKRDTIRTVRALRQRPDVALADLNYVRRALATPSDEHYRLQWHYPLMRLPQAWDVTKGSASVVVAVIDSGVLLAHPDFAGKLVDGYDFISNVSMSRDGDGADINPNDPGTSPSVGQSSWHGTHVAATIGAATDNAVGVAGVGWNTKILPVRVLGLNGSGTSFDIIQGVKWAAGIIDAAGRPAANGTPRAQIINLSLGGFGNSTTEQTMYNDIRAKGVAVVAAAGNDNTSQLFYPASYNNVVSVSAIDMVGNKAPYSNFGAKVDVAAPGGDMTSDRDGNGFPDGVLSAVGYDSTGVLQFDYWFMNGTSMAAPHVAGVVALMKAACPTITPGAIDSLIAAGTVTSDLGTPGRDDVYGYGALDALAAVQAAQTACSATPATTFDVAPTRLDFQPAPAPASLSIRVTKRGAGALPAAVTATDSAPWLAVTQASVDAEGVGTWTATVTRPTATGIYSATITFQAGTLAVQVPVTMQVGAATTSSANAGFVYLLLVDANKLATDPANSTVDQKSKAATAGAYAYSFTTVPAGGKQYYIVAGTDSDDDGAICDAGESCGAYPSLTQPVAIDPTAPPGALNFLIGFGGSLGGASAGTEARGLAVPAEGFRLLARPKVVGAAP